MAPGAESTRKPGSGGADREARNPLRRAFWLGVVVACGFLIALLLSFGVPWLLLKSGVGTGYEVGFLRWGTAEYRRRFGAETRTRRDVVGWASGCPIPASSRFASPAGASTAGRG